MKKLAKYIALLMSVLMIITSTAIVGNAITVEKDGREYFLRSHTPTTGDCKVLIIRLGFADCPIDDEDYPADSEETLLSYFDGSKGSVNEFYETSSYGKLHLSCDKVYSYTAEYSREDYDGENDNALSDFNSLIQEALSALEDEINYDEYDSDGDGYLDFVCFDFSGPLSNWAGTWWPKVMVANDITAGNKRINLYSTLRGEINIFIHEFGHILGAVDYYSTDNNQYDAIMTYDIMCKKDGDHNGFTKWSYGWLDDDNITFVDKALGDITVELVPIDSTADGKKIAVVAPTLEGSFLDEYFLVEYDSGTGNNSEVFKENKLTPGFRVFHINAKSNFEENYGVINYSKSNINLRDNLIHNVKNEYGDPDSWTKSSENMLYREGDVLSYDTNPNTGFSADGVYNGLFTGISFTDFVTGEHPSFKVSFTDEYSSDIKPNLTLNYEKLGADMKMMINSDKPLTLANYEDFDEYENHEPYLIDNRGNKLRISISSVKGSLFSYECNYDMGYPPIQPNSEYTLIIPEGFFLTDYNKIVAEFKQTVKTDDFMGLTTISTSYPESKKLRSNIFAVTDKTYGVIDAPYVNDNGTCTFNEYNLAGKEISHVEFKAPDFGVGEDTVFFRCNVFKLNDDNYALEMCSGDDYYFVKIDRNGKTLSDVFHISDSLISAYTYSFSNEDLDLYKGGLCKFLVADDYEHAVFLKIDFENEPTLEETDENYYYYSLGSDAYAIEKYYDDSNHLLIYDNADKQVGEISFNDSFLCAFKDGENITVVTDKFDWENEISTSYANTYSRNGELLESKDITEKAEHINEYGVFSCCYPNKNGYFLKSFDPDGETVVAYDKDWRYIGELSFDDQVRPYFVDNCGLIKENKYLYEQGECEIISRFNIGNIEIAPIPEKTSISRAKISGLKNKTYTGKAIKQNLTLVYNGKKLVQSTDYTVLYSNNKKVGTASVTIKGKGSYTGSVTKTFKITKAANTVTVSARTRTIKALKTKTAKQTVSAITVKNAKGTVNYKKVSGSKYLKVNSKGKIVVKKGAEVGIYKIKVKVTAKGNLNYKRKTKVVIVKIKIK